MEINVLTPAIYDDDDDNNDDHDEDDNGYVGGDGDK